MRAVTSLAGLHVDTTHRLLPPCHGAAGSSASARDVRVALPAKPDALAAYLLSMQSGTSTAAGSGAGASSASDNARFFTDPFEREGSLRVVTVHTLPALCGLIQEHLETFLVRIRVGSCGVWRMAASVPPLYLCARCHMCDCVQHGPGCVLFVYSMVLTRGIATMAADMGSSLSLIYKDACSEQNLVNLLLTGVGCYGIDVATCVHASACCASCVGTAVTGCGCVPCVAWLFLIPQMVGLGRTFGRRVLDCGTAALPRDAFAMPSIPCVGTVWRGPLYDPVGI